MKAENLLKEAHELSHKFYSLLGYAPPKDYRLPNGH